MIRRVRPPARGASPDRFALGQHVSRWERGSGRLIALKLLVAALIIGFLVLRWGWHS